jgi:hypothetical protein
MTGLFLLKMKAAYLDIADEMEGLGRKIKGLDHQIPYQIASEIAFYLISRAEILREKASWIREGPREGLEGLDFGRVYQKKSH